MKGKCITCGGPMARGTVPHLTSSGKAMLVVSGVPATVCRECGEAWFSPDVVDGLRSIVTKVTSGRLKPADTVPTVSYKAGVRTKAGAATKKRRPTAPRLSKPVL